MEEKERGETETGRGGDRDRDSERGVQIEQEKIQHPPLKVTF